MWSTVREATDSNTIMWSTVREATDSNTIMWSIVREATDNNTIMWSIVREATDNNTIIRSCPFYAGRLKTTDKQSEYVLCVAFSTATVVTRTNFCATFTAHCLFSYYYYHHKIFNCT